MMSNVVPLGMFKVMCLAVRGCIKYLEVLINDILYGISVILDIIIEHLLILFTYGNQVLC